MTTYFAATIGLLHDSGKKINTAAIKKYKKLHKTSQTPDTLHNFDIKIKPYSRFFGEETVLLTGIFSSIVRRRKTEQGLTKP
jgi:membrane-bound lytic murein transglycosylase